MSNTSFNKYATRTREEKDSTCDDNYEIIQDLIIQRKEYERNSNQNQPLNENNKDNTKQHIKRQLTSTSRYGDDDIDEDDNNSFQFVTRNNKRKQQRLNDNNDLTVIEHNSPQTSNN
ncbi:unnamed protein product [Rotaria sp. Silwood2]|nr:unnamed protein product [Rotaria sp. Silwood2]CAF2915237.1 unnamed protein product [Rotaria sp. Silwood2]CAF3204183.1 unnamed protein product [Rotaria sp. Silwood2]CAF3356746.1 unnamed protein product [Rotaria sp. Silwood2]CAF4297749.1 unnamed protein product [Rotaria sp. Silwood2]